MKISKLQFSKYRLVAAKLVITYEGKRENESGRISSGTFLGKTAPIWWMTGKIEGTVQGTQYDPENDTYTPWYGRVKPKSSLTNKWFVKSVYDYSDETSQFMNFDLVHDLPGYQSTVIKKGQKYSMYAYPIDNSYFDFQNVGSYGKSEKICYDTQMQITSTSADNYDIVVNPTVLAGYQEKQDATTNHVGTTTTTGTEVRFSTPDVTIPAHVITLEAVQAVEQPVFHVQLYETYEVIVDPSLNNINMGNPNILQASLLEPIRAQTAVLTKSPLIEQKAEKAVNAAVNNILNQSQEIFANSQQGNNNNNNDVNMSFNQALANVVGPIVANAVKSQVGRRRKKF